MAELPTTTTADSEIIPDTFGGFSEAEIAASPKEKIRTKHTPIAKSVIEHLHKAGLIGSDDDRGVVAILKRINHAIFADESIGNLSALQSEFRKQLAESGGDISKLTEGGAQSLVVRMNQAYLRERFEHFENSADSLRNVAHPEMGTFEMGEVIKRAEEKAKKYRDEYDFYEANSDIINKTVAAHPQVFDRYHNLGEILQLSGVAKGEPGAIREKSDDVMAEVAAARLFDIAPGVMVFSKEKLKEFKTSPTEYITNIIYAAEDTALHTTGLPRLKLFNNPDMTPELRQVQAFSALAGAVLNALTSHSRNADGSTNPPIQVLAENLSTVPEWVHEFQMVVASLVDNNFKTGTSAEDKKMLSLEGDFVELALSRQIPLRNAEETKRKAVELVAKASTLLRNKFADRQDLLVKVDKLVADALGKAPEQGFAAKEAKPADSFAADAAAQKETTVAASR